MNNFNKTNEQLIKNLQNTWKKVYIWEDKPHNIYEKHSHDYDTLLVIFDGTMKIEVNNKILNLSSGDKIRIKSGDIHTVNVGKDGCIYIVGEKLK